MNDTECDKKVSQAAQSGENDSSQCWIFQVYKEGTRRTSLEKEC